MTGKPMPLDRLATIAAGWLVLVAGCSAPPVGPAANAPVTLRVGDEKDLAAILDKHRGKLVLVDFWATWCPPCVAMLPHTVGLQRRWGDKGLAVVTVSFDSPQREAIVLDALQRAQANTENLLSRYGAGVQSVESFEAGEGALPYLKLFDRQGKLVRTFGLGGDQPEPDVIDRAVESLMTP